MNLRFLFPNGHCAATHNWPAVPRVGDQVFLPTDLSSAGCRRGFWVKSVAWAPEMRQEFGATGFCSNVAVPEMVAIDVTLSEESS